MARRSHTRAMCFCSNKLKTHAGSSGTREISSPQVGASSLTLTFLVSVGMAKGAATVELSFVLRASAVRSRCVMAASVNSSHPCSGQSTTREERQSRRISKSRGPIWNRVLTKSRMRLVAALSLGSGDERIKSRVSRTVVHTRVAVRFMFLLPHRSWHIFNSSCSLWISDARLIKSSCVLS